MIKRKIRIYLGAILVSSMFLTGCDTDVVSLLPEEIVANAVEADNNFSNYYAESEIIMYDKEEIIEKTYMKEWVMKINGKTMKRVETKGKDEKDSVVAVNDGRNLTSYIAKENKVIKANLGDEASSLIELSPKDQMKKAFEFIDKTHEIENSGEEKINGIDTYHLKAVPKKQDSIVGEQDFWIEKDKWFTVKSISKTGDMKIEIEYKKIDYKSKIDESVFNFEVPEDAEIVNIDEQSKIKSASLDEVKDIFNKSFLYLKDSKNYVLKDTNIVTLDNKEFPDEISQEYIKDGKPVFSLSVLKPKETSYEVGLPGSKEIVIRGGKGSYIDDTIKIITFDEKGLRYNMILHVNNISIEECIKIVDSLSYYE
ncbi:hypothetical protein Curi_c22920 [Gottschalkia acidurici 9a]|uniref:Lipoprotein n=1 Tax=Gottschalkia acidurici (strain ATCC 7906 / DSM 604 / BCRC 14475 / CIP 104303 / KCTC 5404 / NCIMB 10678 / 9a) TaxID=1128398 RepID=K0B1B7_GOTA9|nr:DUF2092 domain-containing protein [Gottschalkia acidurici]AFS79294.1 hypothetical protein Curi_c22920 [Gottschalkia acidurici 9a]